MTEEVGEIQAPTLIMHGKDDNIPIEESYLAASLIPNSEMVVLDSANHILQPDEAAWDCFVKTVNEFLVN